MKAIRMHDVVALLEDVPATHFKTGQPLTLGRGEVGTVVMTYDGATGEVEFAADDGCPHAIHPVHPSKLLILRDLPDFALALGAARRSEPRPSDRFVVASQEFSHALLYVSGAASRNTMPTG